MRDSDSDSDVEQHRGTFRISEESPPSESVGESAALTHHPSSFLQFLSAKRGTKGIKSHEATTPTSSSGNCYLLYYNLLFGRILDFGMDKE
ncbi:uncharacterized protein UDID_17094 [Ustilago sp. UG-2017a]|nr:uncharacterized protein UDID_17094 [Ustilago sp. UG-2017a]